MSGLGFKAVHIVEARYMQHIRAPLERYGFVQQDADSQTFHRQYHRRAVMVAKHTQDTVLCPDRRNNMVEPPDQRLQRCMNIVPYIAGYHAQIRIHSGNSVRKHGGGIDKIVQMKIGQVQYSISVEGTRQIGLRHGQLGHFKSEGTGRAPAEKPRRTKQIVDVMRCSIKLAVPPLAARPGVIRVAVMGAVHKSQSLEVHRPSSLRTNIFANPAWPRPDNRAAPSGFPLS